MAALNIGPEADAARQEASATKGADNYERIRKMNQDIPIRKSSPEPT